MIHLSFPEDSLSILQEGERIATAIDDKKSRIRFYTNMGLYYSLKGKQAEGRKYSGKAFEDAEKIQDLESMAQAGPDIALSHMTEGDYYNAIDITSRVNNLIEKTQMQAETFGGPAIVYPALMVLCGYSKGMLGDFKGALADCDRAVKNAVSYGNTPAKLFSEFWSGMVYLNRGDWKTARNHLQKGIKLSEETSFSLTLALAWSGLGLAEAELANPEGGIKFVEKGLKIQREANIDWHMCFHFFSLSICHCYTGDLIKASDLMEEAYRLAENSQERPYAGKSLIWLGRLTGLADSHKKNEAIEYIQRGLKILSALQTKPDVSIAYLFLGEIYWSLGLADKASSFLKKAAEMFEEMGMDYWLDKTQEVLEQL
jgi:tetratricopeptide (TPR) repeat protein